MANSKRSTRKPLKNNRKQQKEDRQATAAFLAFAESFMREPDMLTRSQRLRIADLAEITGMSERLFVRRAISNFLHDEAPVWAARASA